VKMPGGGGGRAARGIRAESPDTQVVALSAYEDRRTVLEMLRAIIPLHEPMESFAHAAVPLISREAAPFFRYRVGDIVSLDDTPWLFSTRSIAGRNPRREGT